MTGADDDRVAVVVVGAGPTGIAAACLLADQGVDVLVLDRWTGVYPRPRAVALDDEVHRILDRLGLAEEFAAISRPAHGLRLVDGADHRVLAEFGRRVEGGAHGFPESSMFDQPELEGLLRKGLARRPGVRLRGDVEVRDVVPHEFLADGAVTVRFVDRTSGRMETVRADWVLGCDGANSVVRRCVGATMTDLGFEQRWLVVDVATAADLGQWEGIQQICSTDRAATYMRIGERRYRWEFQLREGEDASAFRTVGDLRPLLQPWVGATPNHELDLVRVTDYVFRAQVADRWRRGRVLILGDAAHLTPPFIGQGMGAGLRDAANLAWKLAAVLRGALPEIDLDSYEAERRPHATAMVRRAVRVGRVMTGGGAVGSAVRRRLIPRLARVPAVERAGARSATPRLRRSRTLPRPTLRPSVVGQLFPNALVGEGARFDDVVRGGFGLVLDRPLPAGSRRQADRRGVTVLEVDPTDPIGRWLREAGVDAVLVRPDGVVSAAGRRACTSSIT